MGLAAWPKLICKTDRNISYGLRPYTSASNRAQGKKKNRTTVAAAGGQTLGRSSFTRATSNPTTSSSAATGVKLGPNGVAFVLSGIPDLDRILGGGFLLGSVVMIMEDADAPHHLLLLRCFMAQGVVHKQPLLFAGPMKEPRLFLGTLPAPISSSKEDGRHRVMGVRSSSDERENDEGLRIAWQYKKYFGDEKTSGGGHKDSKQDFSNDFDLRKPLERHLLNGQNIECVSTQDADTLSDLQDRCSAFLSKLPRKDVGSLTAGRIAIQSLCAPQCGYFENDWDMVSFIRSVKAMVRSSNSVAVITFPSTVLSSSFCKRWQHLADTLLSIKAIPDEDKDLAKLLTGYQDMVGFLHVHKVVQTNSQHVPVILEASTLSLKLRKRRSLVLERLNQAPVDGSSTQVGLRQLQQAVARRHKVHSLISNLDSDVIAGSTKREIQQCCILVTPDKM